EQEENLRKAKAKLQLAEEKVTKCRRWLAQLPRAILEYEGPGRQLAGVIDTEVPKMLGLLDRKLAALEAYLKIAPPETRPLPPESLAASVSMANAVEESPPTTVAIDDDRKTEERNVDNQQPTANR